MLKDLAPPAVKRSVKSTLEAARTASAFARPLPDFLIIGAQKGGTTALYSYLRQHPAIGGPASKEVEFFDRHFARGAAWYRGHFPTAVQRRYVERRRGGTFLAGEASPDYLSHPWAARRARSVVPDARLIVLLRNPVDRALSAYAHEIAAGRETLSFRDALEQHAGDTESELSRMGADPGYYSLSWRYNAHLLRGRYAEQLERWFAEFPREQILVLGSERDFFADPGVAYARVLGFLGAAPHRLDAYPPVLARDYLEMDADTRRWLADYYREPNERLYALLGRDFGWA